MGSLDRLVDKWLNEPGFQGRMRRDPEGTVKGSGLTLNAEEWAMLKNIVMTTSDAELRARVNKSPLN